MKCIEISTIVIISAFGLCKRQDIDWTGGCGPHHTGAGISLDTGSLLEISIYFIYMFLATDIEGSISLSSSERFIDAGTASNFQGPNFESSMLTLRNPGIINLPSLGYTNAPRVNRVRDAIKN